jgi:hypothetical protein
MSKEKPNNHKLTDSEEVEVTEKELFREQIDEWLETYLDDIFSNLMEVDLAEEDESKERHGE